MTKNEQTERQKKEWMKLKNEQMKKKLIQK